MPLEDPTCIDIITRSTDGKVTLVITDSGLTTDPEVRFSKLVEKVTTYLSYVLGSTFGEDHPGVAIGDVGIKVLCATQPSEKMSRFNRLTNPEDDKEWIGIEYELFEGSMPRAEPDSEEPRREEKRSGPTVSRIHLTNWIFRLAILGLFLSGVYRIVFLNQAPWTPWLMALVIWVLRYVRRRRRWNKIKNDLIAGGFPSEYFEKKKSEKEDRE